MSSPATNKQRPTNISDVLSQLANTNAANALAQSGNSYLSQIAMLVDAETELDALETPLVVTGGYRLDSAGVGAAGVNVISASGLASYWDLDEGLGSIAHDLSGNGNNGTIAGSPAWVAGMFGDALEFTSPSQSVTKSAPSGLSTSQISLSVWAKISTYASYILFLYVGLGAGEASVIASSIGVITATIRDNSNVQHTVTYTLGTSDHNPHNLILTFDGTTLTLYVDGVSRGIPNTGAAGTTLSTSAITISCIGSPHWVEDEARVYARALSAAEAASLCAQRAGLYLDASLTGAGELDF